ncbi:MAG: pyruvate, phosphate dikinase [Phycisphaerae bacterium]|nr:pyruvate, phosphate dikinase [Phycisphaerae bacterium]
MPDMDSPTHESDSSEGLGHDPQETEAVLRELLAGHPQLAERVHRELMVALHKRGIVGVDALYDEARRRLGTAPSEKTRDPNIVTRTPWDERERRAVEELIHEFVSRRFTPAEVEDIVNLTLKREKMQSLEQVANLPSVTFRQLADEVQRFCELPVGETRVPPSEMIGTRVALIRHFLSDQLEFLAIAKQHLIVRDFEDVTRRMIGGDQGMGRIGGKAGGMILANRILTSAEEGKEPFLPLATPESYYLRSDVIEEFLSLNRFQEYRNQKYKPIQDVAREYPIIRGVFRNGDFPLKIVHQLRRVLEQLGPDPLIVRSSSLLEDRLGTAFSGKYASFFLANQGSLEYRLRALLGAIAEVYASVLSADPILYRREHDLIDYVESMAVLIQKVVGTRVGKYYLPAFAGVAFSRNEYRWSPRIRREDGMARLVVGLGTRAVDRGGPDYPRMVALAAPTLRPESNTQEIRRGAQQTVDVIDLEQNRFRSIRVRELLEEAPDFPMLDKIISIHRDGGLYAPTMLHVDAEPDDMVVTFDKLVRSTPFAQRIRGILDLLERAYERPVDIEFACDGENLYVLQCRSLSQTAESSPAQPPDDVRPEDVIFDARKYVRSGMIDRIEYVVYVDPRAYDAIPDLDRRYELARVVGRVNHRLERGTFILMGPGRWGSKDIRLGVPVRYADINRCRMLIEIARAKGGFVPEVSFGTHFFQDLVEAKIQYLPLYPDESPNRFNERFFDESPNVLAELLPEDAEFSEELRVICVPTATSGRRVHVAMDGEADYAVAYLR